MQKSSVSTAKASTVRLLHSRSDDAAALALGSDLLDSNGKRLRKRPLIRQGCANLIRSTGGIQYVEHADGHGERMFAAVCRLGLEGIVRSVRVRLIVRDQRGPGSRSKILTRRLQPAPRMVRSESAMPRDRAN